MKIPILKAVFKNQKLILRPRGQSYCSQRMDKWDDLVELPPHAESALFTLRKCMGQMLQSTQRKPIVRELLYQGILNYAVLQASKDPFAIYGSTAWNFYLPSWLAFERSDLDLKLIQCYKPLHLKNYVNGLKESLMVQFPQHEFRVGESRHNGNRTLIVSCDNDAILDVSICSLLETEVTTTQNTQGINVMSFDWMLSDLAAMLELSTTDYRREKDLLRLERLYLAQRLNVLINCTTSQKLNGLAEKYSISTENKLPILNKLENRLSAVDDLIQTRQIELDTAERQATELRLELAQERQEKRHCEKKLKLAEDTCDQLNSSLGKLTEELTASKQTETELRASLASLTAQLRRTEQSLASRSKPAKQQVNKSKKTKKQSDDHLFRNLLNEDQVKTIAQLKSEADGLRKDKIAMQNTIDTQGERVAQLIELRRRLYSNNALLEDERATLQGKLEHAYSSSQLALSSFVRCQKYFQTAMSLVFFQNAIRLLGVGTCRDAEAYEKDLPCTIFCAQCIDASLKRRDATTVVDQFLICTFAYNANTFNPHSIGMYDAADGLTLNIPSNTSSTTDTEEVSKAQLEPASAPIEGIILIPLAPVEKTDKDIKTNLWISGRQKFAEDDRFYYVLCSNCLLDNVQDCVARHHVLPPAKLS